MSKEQSQTKDNNRNNTEPEVLGQAGINKRFIQPIVFFVSLELLAGAAAIFYA